MMGSPPGAHHFPVAGPDNPAPCRTGSTAGMQRRGDDSIRARIARARARARGRQPASSGAASDAEAAGATAGNPGAPAAHGPLGRGRGGSPRADRPRRGTPLRVRRQAEPDAGHGWIGEHLPPGLLEIASDRPLRTGPAVPGFRPVRRTGATRSVPRTRPAITGPAPYSLGKHRRRSSLAGENDRRPDLSPGYG